MVTTSGNPEGRTYSHLKPIQYVKSYPRFEETHIPRHVRIHLVSPTKKRGVSDVDRVRREYARKVAPGRMEALKIYTYVQQRRGVKPFSNVKDIYLDTSKRHYLAHYGKHKMEKGPDQMAISISSHIYPDKGLTPQEHVSTLIAHEEAHAKESLSDKERKQLDKYERELLRKHEKATTIKKANEYYSRYTHIPEEHAAFQEQRAYRKDIKKFKKQYRKEQNPQYQEQAILSDIYQD